MIVVRAVQGRRDIIRSRVHDGYGSVDDLADIASCVLCLVFYRVVAGGCRVHRFGRGEFGLSVVASHTWIHVRVIGPNSVRRRTKKC